MTIELVKNPPADAGDTVWEGPIGLGAAKRMRQDRWGPRTLKPTRAEKTLQQAATRQTQRGAPASWGSPRAAEDARIHALI